MQKLFMDCLFSAELKGKDAFTYFTEDSKEFTVVCTFSHYRMYWHTPYWVSGSCVWAWGSAAGVRVGRVHYWDIQENWNQPPFKLWLFPPRAARQQTGAVRMKPTAPTAMGAALCQARGWAELNIQQGSVGLQQNQHYIAIASQKSHLVSPSSQTTGEVWTCLGLSGDQTGASVAGFSYSLALCNCMV